MEVMFPDDPLDFSPRVPDVTPFFPFFHTAALSCFLSPSPLFHSFSPRPSHSFPYALLYSLAYFVPPFFSPALRSFSRRRCGAARSEVSRFAIRESGPMTHLVAIFIRLAPTSDSFLALHLSLTHERACRRFVTRRIHVTFTSLSFFFTCLTLFRNSVSFVISRYGFHELSAVSRHGCATCPKLKRARVRARCLFLCPFSLSLSLLLSASLYIIRSSLPSFISCSTLRALNRTTLRAVFFAEVLSG